jgi:hypothetical protein
MRMAVPPRWTISFADLALLLLGCFVMMNALRPASPPAAAAATGAAATMELGASDLFEPGEARLTAAGRARLADVARAAEGGRIVLASRGAESGGERLDAFELAAARTAAVGRALGIVTGDVSASVEPGEGEGAGQRISVRILR